MLGRFARLMLVAAFLLTCHGLAAPALSWGQETIRTVHPLYSMTLPDGSMMGGSEPLTIRVAPSDSGRARVGFFESDFRSSGAKWRASGWAASVAASLYAGFPLSEWRISFDIAGFIDGPSAGALMAVGLLAAVNDVELIAGATMTGTVNPDGSIGVVGDLSLKLQGASNAGMTLVLIPTGSRMATQPDGSVLDLQARARELGLEVKEVATLGEAYYLLTGQRLPAGTTDDGREFALPEAVNVAVSESYSEWSERCQASLMGIADKAPYVPENLRPILAEFVSSAEQYRGRGQALFQNGLVCSGLLLVFNAATVADAANNLAALYAGYGESGLAGMELVLGEQFLDEELLDHHREILAGQELANLSDLAVLAEAYAFHNAATVIHQQSKELLLTAMSDPSLSRDNPFLFSLMESVSARESYARNGLLFTGDLLAMGMGHPGPPLPGDESLQDWSGVMHHAAGANLRYFEAVVVARHADNQSISLSEARHELEAADFHLAWAQTSFDAHRLARDNAAGSSHMAASTLGASVASYYLSSLVITKYSCLGDIEGDSGFIAAVAAHERLDALLNTGFDRLRNVILASETQGYTPILPIFHLRAGMGLLATSETLDEKLLSLSEFWAGSTFGRTMNILAEASPPIIPEAGQTFSLTYGLAVKFLDKAFYEVEAAIEWRVANHPVYQAMVVDDDFAAERVQEALDTALQNVLGRLVADEVATTQQAVEEEIQVQCNELLKAYGIEVATVSLGVGNRIVVDE
ncbi:MAG: hypothetical protein D6E12_03235 [Desulfovibrio sp.]|nr:MAG: hypothetical protein D6E12_03235 [Desulfovibrio sp.]